MQASHAAMALWLSHRTMRFSNLFLLLSIASSTIKAVACMPPKAKVVAAAAAVADADSDGEGRHDDLGLDGGYASAASDDAPRRDSTHSTGNAASTSHRYRTITHNKWLPVIPSTLPSSLIALCDVPVEVRRPHWEVLRVCPEVGSS